MNAALSARRAIVVVGAAVLVGCGGGGDSPPAESGGAPPTLPAGTDIGCGLVGFREEALRLLNERRAAGANCRSAGTFTPAGALAWNDALTSAAHGHSRDMADQNYFDHTSPTRGTFERRINASGYPWSLIGENIAAGQTSVAQVVNGWMASDGHCRNIMTAAFRDIGMACARNDSSQWKLYYTLDLAAPH